jgi:hypothetical protein
MLTLGDINNIEYQDDTVDEYDYYASIQRAINAKAWSFQGSYGRAMMDAISAGKCLLGKTPCNDYWGNRIPSRDEVKAGTKGSADYVADCNGQDWLKLMEAV